MEKEKKLCRIEEGKMIAGVCTGLGDYFSIDTTLIRVGWVILGLMCGFGLIGYLIAALIIPKKA